MNLSFTKNGLKHEPINNWELPDGTKIAIYQGSRGGNPDLDFIVKYKNGNSRLRTPSHTHWIVDLIIKSEYAPYEVKNFVSEWVNLYDLIEPFKTKDEMKSYNFLYYEYFIEKYDTITNVGPLKIEFLCGLLELFIKCEKQTKDAFMFKKLLELVMEYCDGKKDFYQIISHSKRV